MTAATSRRPELAIALDFTSRDLLFSWINQFEGLPLVLKLGLGLLPELRFDDYTALKKSGFKIFIDAKLHDIPTQVQRAVAKWVEAGADYLTLHTLGGPKMCAAAQEVEAGSPLRLLGVTVLTSHNDAELESMGFARNARALVLDLIRMGCDAGLSSFVCSAHELEAIRAFGKEKGRPELFLATPGLVLKERENHPDQARVMTASDAIDRGSDLLVIGRSLLASVEPRLEVERLLKRCVTR